MQLKTMTLTALMKLFNSGCINDDNEVNTDLVGEAGYEDGVKLGIKICQAMPCSVSKDLFTLERDLKENYQVLCNKEIAAMLDCMFKIWEFEAWQQLEVMLQHDEIFETYLHHFILGISDSFIERAAGCRKCRAE